MVRDFRKDFPFFNTSENKDLAYLDSSATTQKPKVVIDGLVDFYTNYNANANRGAYDLTIKATSLIEKTRSKIGNFLGVTDPSQIIFTKSATESINLLAYSLGQDLKEGDEVLVSVAEHHANFVSWQEICKRRGATFKVFHLTDDLAYDLEEFEQMLNENTKIVAFSSASNVISFDVPVRQMVDLAHKVGAKTIIDGTQEVAHKRVDLKDYDTDFYVLSGHKIYGPTGVGVLYGKKEHLQEMDPFLLGGDMIEYVTEKETSFREIPSKFEAGTQDAAAIYGLGLAIDYVQDLGFDQISKVEEDLVEYLIKEICALDFVETYLPKKLAGTNVAFNIKGVHPHDVSQILDMMGVAVRVGHHCAQPLHRFLGLNSTCRASVAFYNTKEEIDKLIVALKKVKEVFYGV